MEFLFVASFSGRAGAIAISNGSFKGQAHGSVGAQKAGKRQSPCSLLLLVHQCCHGTPQVLVGAHGANMANMLFAPDGMKVVEIVPQAKGVSVSVSLLVHRE